MNFKKSPLKHIDPSPKSDSRTPRRRDNFLLSVESVGSPDARITELNREIDNLYRICDCMRCDMDRLKEANTKLIRRMNEMEIKNGSWCLVM